MHSSDKSSERALWSNGIVAGYGNRVVVKGVSLELASGEVLAVIGHNGSGKSTLLKSLYGLLPLLGGTVEYACAPRGALSPAVLLRRGVSYLPQGRRVFPQLTVQQNLTVSAANALEPGDVAAGVERALSLFSVLKPRQHERSGLLSAGQQQMLALARALMVPPRVLLADEPTMGLASEVGMEVLGRLSDLAHHSNVAVLVVEQRVREILQHSDRVYVLRDGKTAFSGSPAELQDEATLRSVYF